MKIATNLVRIEFCTKAFSLGVRRFFFLLRRREIPPSPGDEKCPLMPQLLQDIAKVEIIFKTNMYTE